MKNVYRRIEALEVAAMLGSNEKTCTIFGFLGTDDDNHELVIHARPVCSSCSVPDR